MVSYSSLCIYWTWPVRFQKFQLITVIISGFLIHLSLGVVYTFGNLVPYIVSYIRARSDPDTLRYTDGTFILACQLVGQGSSSILGGLLEKKLGPRLVTLFGGWFMSLGVLLSYFSIQYSFYLLLVTYGLMFGIGIGTAYIGPLSCAMRWLPKWKGLASGIIVSGFGLSAFFFDGIQTTFINPTNKQPDLAPVSENMDEKYFSQPDVLDKVPIYFLLQGGILASMQLLGAIFLVNPAPINEGSVSYHKTENGQNGHVLLEELTNSTKKETSTTNDSIQDVPPHKVFTKVKFYIVWCMFLIAGIVATFINSLYKTFGFEDITHDDHFLTIVGSISAVFNCIGRVLWGILADITDYKFALVLQSSLMTCLLSTLYVTGFGGKAMFFIWICLIFFCVGGYFSLFPTAAAKLFGSKYISINYSLLFTALAIASVLAAFISHLLVKLIDWYGVFLILSGLHLIELLLSVFISFPCFSLVQYLFSMVSYASLCVYWNWPSRLHKLQVIIVLLSAFLIHLSLGYTHTFGNLIPYIVSYTVARSYPVTLRYTDGIILSTVQNVASVPCLILGGFLERKLGPRVVSLCGGSCLSLGVLLSYFSIQHSFYLLLVTYGLMFGIGIGAAFISPTSCAMKWLPNWKGLASGIVTAGFALSPVIFVPLQTIFINPHNKSPDAAAVECGEKYFFQPDVLDRVPLYFLLQGSILAILQFIGAIFLVNPAPVSDDDNKVVNNTHELHELNNVSLNSAKKDQSKDHELHELSNESLNAAKNQSKDNENTQDGVSPCKLFTKINFYILWMMYFIFLAVSDFLLRLYKTFGFEEVTTDDHFHAVLGSIAALCNCIGRVLWGALADITDHRFALVLQSSLMTCLLGTLYVTSVGGKPMFFIWICLIFLCRSSIFAKAANETFGSKHFSVNLSLLMSCDIFAALFATLLSQFLLRYIYWHGAFFILAGLCLVEFFLAIFYDIYNF